MSLETISRKAATMSLNARQLHTDPTPATITPLSDSSSFPIPTYTLTRTLDGVQTDLLIQSYEDRVFVMITQVGKMGFLTQATLSPLLPLLNPTKQPPTDPTRPPSSSSTLTQILPMLPPPHPSILLTPLLGTPRDPSDQTRDELYISQIATLVWWLGENPNLPGRRAGTAGQRRPVVVSLALSRTKPVKADRTGEDDDDDDDDDLSAGDSEKERERFAGIMGMIAEWSGE